MRNLFIYGAMGFGKEVYIYNKQKNPQEKIDFSIFILEQIQSFILKNNDTRI